LLDAPAAIGGTFNVCSGQAVSLGEVLAMVRELTGEAMEVRVNPAFVRSDEVKTLTGNPARLESVVGRHETIPLADTLRWMLEG
jgi:nucleoside-diphosphate-sugar epimerase